MFEKILEFFATKEVYSEAEIYYTPTLAGNIALFVLAAILCIAILVLFVPVVQNGLSEVRKMAIQ